MCVFMCVCVYAHIYCLCCGDINLHMVVLWVLAPGCDIWFWFEFILRKVVVPLTKGLHQFCVKSKLTFLQYVHTYMQ